MSAATALKLLQQFAAEKKEITEDDSNIIFGDQGTFPKTLPTGFKTMTKTEGYQLHALVFFHKQHAANQDLAGDTPEAKRKFMNHYLNRCAKENVAAVQFSDYDVVVNFIAGKDVKGRTGAAGQSLLGIETDDINALKALQDRLEDETSVVDFVAMKNETTLSSRLNTVSVTGIDFSEHYQQINDKVHKAWMEILKRKASKDKVKHGTPIIVVPSAPASTITLWNVKSFLDSCLYVPSMEIKKKHKGLAPKSVEISHTFSDGKVLKFQIVSAYMDLPKARRDDVVAIFVHGPDWQFKGWRFKNVSEIFCKFKCFHLKFRGERIHANIAKWNTVRTLEIGKTNRATDVAAVHTFWGQLETYLRLKCTYLFDESSNAGDNGKNQEGGDSKRART